MPSVFLDTNILVYAASARRADPDKWNRALDVIETSDFAVSGQVLAEFVNVVRSKISPPIPEDELDVWLDELGHREVAAVDAELVRRGVAVARRFGISYWDGAIIAAADRLGCHTLMTEDLNHGHAYGPVRVENPFMD